MKNFAPVSFGLIIIVGFFACLWILLTKAYPADNKDLITSLIETLKNILIMAVSYYFGTTASGKSKDETISDIARMPIASTPAAPVAPINIPAAKTVTVKTETGDVTVSPQSNQQPKEESA